MSQPSTVETGTAYELLVQAIYREIIRAEGVDTIDVQHNVKVEGKSGCEHQVDLFWEFKVAGKRYRTAIECKAYNTEVSIGKIRDFYGVIVDVNDLSGIFVAQKGFQSGARKFAEHYGISLKELREPTEDDWKGRVREIHVNFNVISVDIVDFRVRPTKAFLSSLPEEGFEFQGVYTTHETIIFDADGKPIASREELRQKLPHGRESVKGLKHSFDFPGHTIRLAGHDIPIDGIDMVYDVDVVTETMVSRGAEIVKAIVRDAIEGDLTVVHHDGRVRTTRQ